MKNNVDVLIVFRQIIYDEVIDDKRGADQAECNDE